LDWVWGFENFLFWFWIVLRLGFVEINSWTLIGKVFEIEERFGLQRGLFEDKERVGDRVWQGRGC
jgi:hypothetical protein